MTSEEATVWISEDSASVELDNCNTNESLSLSPRDILLKPTSNNVKHVTTPKHP